MRQVKPVLCIPTACRWRSRRVSPPRRQASGFTYNNYIGLDQWNDAVFNGTFDEMRIWDGAVSQRYLSASAVAGPNVMINNLTPTSVSLTAGPAVVITGTEQATVTVQLPQTGSANLSGNRRRHQLGQQQPGRAHGEQQRFDHRGWRRQRHGQRHGRRRHCHQRQHHRHPPDPFASLQFRQRCFRFGGRPAWNGTLVAARRRSCRQHSQRPYPAGEYGWRIGYSGYVSLPRWDTDQHHLANG